MHCCLHCRTRKATIRLGWPSCPGKLVWHGLHCCFEVLERLSFEQVNLYFLKSYILEFRKFKYYCLFSGSWKRSLRVWQLNVALLKECCGHREWLFLTYVIFHWLLVDLPGLSKVTLIYSFFYLTVMITGLILCWHLLMKKSRTRLIENLLFRALSWPVTGRFSRFILSVTSESLNWIKFRSNWYLIIFYSGYEKY